MPTDPVFNDQELLIACLSCGRAWIQDLPHMWCYEDREAYLRQHRKCQQCGSQESKIIGMKPEAVLDDGSTPDDPPISDSYTVRDRFAAAALSGILATGNSPLEIDDLAAEAYRYADAMLEVRVT